MVELVRCDVQALRVETGCHGVQAEETVELNGRGILVKVKGTMDTTGLRATTGMMDLMDMMGSMGMRGLLGSTSNCWERCSSCRH